LDDAADLLRIPSAILKLFVAFNHGDQASVSYILDEILNMIQEWSNKANLNKSEKLANLDEYKNKLLWL